MVDRVYVIFQDSCPRVVTKNKMTAQEPPTFGTTIFWNGSNIFDKTKSGNVSDFIHHQPRCVPKAAPYRG